MLRLAFERYPKDIAIQSTVLQIILTVAKDATQTLLGRESTIPRLDVFEMLYKVIGN